MKFEYGKILILMLLTVTQCSFDKESAINLESKGLYELAQMVRPDFMMGTHLHAALTSMSQENRKAYEIITKNYNLVSAGIYQNQTQHDSQDNWSFNGVDPIIDFASENRKIVYAHPLFGSNQYVPEWFKNGNYSNEELLSILEDRVKTILTRYKDKIGIIDIYNEALDRGDSGEWRAQDNFLLKLGWRETEFGRWPIVLEKLLVWARKYGGENLKLIYNDNHNTLFGLPQSVKCIEMFTALKKAGIPIDGIGIQCHTGITEKGEHRLSASASESSPLFDADLFAKNLKAMGEAGIDVYISECDVHLYGEITEEKLQLQAKAYASILKTCIEAPACKVFKTWGFTDKDCWRPFKERQAEPCPLVFDMELNPKPAYFAMRDLLIKKILKNQ